MGKGQSLKAFTAELGGGNQRNITIGNDRSLTEAYCQLDLQREAKAFIGPLPRSANIVYGSLGFKTKQIPSGVAKRNIKGPLLFKWCRVEYNKNTNRLEIPKGEYIGKTCYRTAESTPKAEDDEYCDIIVNCNLDEIDSQGKISIYIYN